MNELLSGVSRMNEASSVHQDLGGEQISKMIETARLLLGEMRKRNEDLEKVEKSFDQLSEELREVRGKVEDVTDQVKSLISDVKDVKPNFAAGEDIKPKLGNNPRFPLPNVLPTPTVLPLQRMPLV